MASEKICCQRGNKSLNILKYCAFFFNFFKSLINTKDPDPEHDSHHNNEISFAKKKCHQKESGGNKVGKEALVTGT